MQTFDYQTVNLDHYPAGNNRLGLRPDELVIDLFCGLGGASTGLKAAIGRDPDIAINHMPEAIAAHQANHPDTLHVIDDIWKVNPFDQELTQGRPVGVLWLSPDCRSFSRAKGGQPRSKSIRSLAWVAIRWAKAVRPRIIMLENVPEFAAWSNTLPNGQPDKKHTGQIFAAWVGKLERLGYRVEYKLLRACDYGAATIRTRLFLVARRDDLPILWPEATHAAPHSVNVCNGRQKPWPIAADIIDFKRPCNSIFMTTAAAKKLRLKRPLAEATLERIAKGIKKYIIDADAPFIIGEKEGCSFITKFRTNSIGSDMADPLPTITANSFEVRPGGATPLGLVTSTSSRLPAKALTIIRHFGESIGSALNEPIGSVTAAGQGKTGLVETTIYRAGHILNQKGSDQRSAAIDQPLPTQTSQGNHIGAIFTDLISAAPGSANDIMASLDPKILKQAKRMARFLRKYGCWGNTPIVILRDHSVLTDCGLRMLGPQELLKAQGFSGSHILDPEYKGKRLNATMQVRLIGNSVCPDVAEAIARANINIAPVAKHCHVRYKPWAEELSQKLRDKHDPKPPGSANPRFGKPPAQRLKTAA